MRNVLIKKAFMAPNAVPITQEMAKARKRLSTPKAIRLLTAMYCPVMAMAGKDMSMPSGQKSHKKGDGQNGHFRNCF